MFNSLQSASEAKILDWLREGGDPDTVLDGDGNTFMHYAATNLLHILQEAVRRGGDCNRKNAHGATPLHFAASQDSLGSGAEALRTLVRCEASPNVRRACASGDRTAEDCRADPNAQDRRGATPLHAVYEGVEGDSLVIRNLGVSSLPDSGGGAREDVVRVLLEELGADPDIRNSNGDTPLMLPIRNINNAAVMSPSKHVSFILEHGADPDARNNKDATPLIETVSLFSAVRDDDDSPRVIHRLIKHGADPDLRDGRGDTPLIRAAQHDDDSVFEIEALLAGGADPCLRDRNGRLAYDHAQTDGALALYNAGGYPDPETGICIRNLFKAEEEEKKLGLDRSVRRRLQSCLKTAGFDPGAPDGLFGPRTRSAVRAWQAAQGREGIEAAGYFALGETHALLEACRTAGPEPRCTGQTGSGCWMEVTNHSDCYIWNPNPQPEELVTWSGRCVDGKVSGMGRSVRRFREDGVSKSSWSEGNHLDGGKSGDGHWVLRFSDGDVWEGPMVGGEYHGLWVERGSGGTATSCQRNGEEADRSRCVAPADGKMQAVEHAGIRSGPGDDYERLGTLQAEERVTVTGEVGVWLAVETQDGHEGFVRTSALALAGPAQDVGDVFRDCDETWCPELVVVPAGSFRMGSPSSEEGRGGDEGPVHRVRIAQPFAVGVYEVTFAEWDACVRDGGCGGHRPDDEGWGRGRRPVINVSWEDAQSYVGWLSRKTGEKYRLLSESEWEYVARAGTTGPFHFGATLSTSQANYDGNFFYGSGRPGEYRGRTVSVGSFPSNEFGLHDVHGNVWEWVEDCWNGSYAGALADGGAWETGDCSRRVMRGGSWKGVPWGLRSANRCRFTAGDRIDFIGFRVARTLTP